MILIFQIPYGKKCNTLDDIIKDGYLPSTFTNHQPSYAVFDIETLEASINRQETEFLTTDANLYVVSIAVASNIEGKNPTFFCRKSSDPVDGYKLVREFLFHLLKLQKHVLNSLPNELKTCIERLQEEQKQTDFKGMHNQNTKTFKYLNYLKQYTSLPVFGFNSSKLIIFFII